MLNHREGKHTTERGIPKDWGKILNNLIKLLNEFINKFALVARVSLVVSGPIVNRIEKKMNPIR